MNGWLATSQAYVADVTDEEGRAKGMGMLGAAFGLGFIFGPALGGYLAGEADVNYQLPMIIAAVGSARFCHQCRHAARAGAPSDKWQIDAHFFTEACAIPSLVIIIALYFALFFVFSGMESTLALWCDKVLGMGPQQVGYYLAFAGICGVIIQGWLVGKLAPKIGRSRLVLIGLFTLAIGLAGLPYVPEPIWLVLPIALLSIGFGFANPSLQSLISRAAPEESARRNNGCRAIGQQFRPNSGPSLGRICFPGGGCRGALRLGSHTP